MKGQSIESIDILKSKVHLLTIEELHQELKRMLQSNEQSIVDYLNIYSANLSYEDPWFADFLNSCSLVLCDGKGIQLGAWMLGKRIPIQIAYNRWIWDFLKFCEKEDFSVFFLGSKPGLVDKAIQKIKEREYHIRLDGFHGYFDKNNHENERVIRLINTFQPDFLIIGLGMPLQEKWIAANKEKLAPKVLLFGGAFLEWMSGDVKLPPRFVTAIGMEWFYRLILEPKRLYKRYLVGIPLFFWRVLYSRF